ncbi:MULTISPECIES: hypothetical protein [Nostoc]|uniref:hypothetical protein n=1 Tax=Nostoc TaxID=1177 RepID=UPI0036F1CE7D
MQLKEFSLISSAIESGTVLKALETAIPAKAITQAIADTHSNEERKRALPTPKRDLFGGSNELVVKSINENSVEKSGRWVE